MLLILLAVLCRVASCLGPLLFLLYVNDLTDIFTDAVTVKLYADDVKIYPSVNEKVIGQELQQNLNKLKNGQVIGSYRFHILNVVFSIHVNMREAQIYYIMHAW